jgi:hypothetical protein
MAPAPHRDTPLLEALISRADHATAAIDWCEENYALSPHVAEFWNAASSLLFCAAGLSLALQAARLPRLRPALALAGPLLLLLGASSAAYHATLALPWQRADEVAENLVLAALLHGAAPTPRPRLLPLLAHFAAAAWGVLRVHALLFTELHLVGAALLLGARLRRQAAAAREPKAAAPPPAAARARVAAAAAALGAAAWLADRAACSALAAAPGGNPQLHAWWHAAGALALHEAWAAAAAAGHALDGGGGGGGDGAAGGVALRVGAGGLLSVVVAA